jgi:ketosteroid isomerase-like protein
MPDGKTVLESYVAALLDGDERAIRASFAEDATWTLHGDLPISGTWRGRDAIVDDFLGTAIGYFDADSVSIEVTGMVGEGEIVAMEWTSRARTTGGEAYENNCIGVFTVRDGEIASVREYMDTRYAARVAFGARV